MKNKRLLLIAFIVIFSDASASLIIEAETPIPEHTSNIQKKEKLSAMEQYMESIGLNKEGISSIKNNLPDGYFEGVDKQLQKINSVFSEMNMEKAQRYIFTRVRGGLVGSYTSYGEILGVLQHSYKIALTDEDLHLVRLQLI